MFAKGKRAFSIGCVALLVVAALHTMGHFAPLPQDPATLDLISTLEGYTFDMPLMPTTAHAVLQSLSLTMTVTLLALGVLGLAAARWSDAGTVRRYARIFAVTDAALVAVYASYRVSPPLLTLAVVLVFFVVAALPAAAPSTSREV